MQRRKEMVTNQPQKTTKLEIGRGVDKRPHRRKFNGTTRDREQRSTSRCLARHRPGPTAAGRGRVRRDVNCPPGGVAEWPCSGLQSRLRRFDSDPRLQTFQRPASPIALFFWRNCFHPAGYAVEAGFTKFGNLVRGRCEARLGAGRMPMRPRRSPRSRRRRASTPRDSSRAHRY